MNPSQLKETTMNPNTRKLIKVIAPANDLEATTNLVMNLMGKNPEPRFEYIINNAVFVDPATI
jgi:topoisomerase-4 subunit B